MLCRHTMFHHTHDRQSITHLSMKYWVQPSVWMYLFIYYVCITCTCICMLSTVGTGVLTCSVIVLYFLYWIKKKKRKEKKRIKKTTTKFKPCSIYPYPSTLTQSQHQGWSFSFIHCKYTQSRQYMIMLQPKQPPLSPPNPLTNDALLWTACVGQYPLTVHWDSPAEAKSWPLGEKARARMDPLCPDSRRMGLPSWMFHRRIVLSHDPDAT